MARKRIQWHPQFTRLLRPRVEAYYELHTGVLVGDLPREADLALLRRRQARPLFDGLWQHLTAWSLLEYKGPTKAARPEHMPLLVELGLGIARRLNEQRRAGPAMPPEQVSFWYLANRLGWRFRRDAEQRLSGMRAVGPGLWQSSVLGHSVFLVSTTDLPVDEDSLPLHVLAREPVEKEREVGEFVAATAARLELYGSPFAVYHPVIWREVEAMTRRGRSSFTLDLRPAIEMVGLKEVIRQVGLKEVIRQAGAKEVIRQIGAKAFLEELGVDNFLASLPPAQRRDLKRRLLEKENGPK
jgi:hypothetical protein